MTTNVPSFPMIETERLILRKVTVDDAESMMKYLSDPDVMEYMGLEPFKSIADVLGEISWYESILSNKTGIRWGITIKEEDKVIGSCGFLNIISKHYRTEIGIDLSKEHWGQGIASEAIEAVIRYGFNQMNLQRIEALIEPMNISSQKLFEQQGFIQEGLLRKYEYTRNGFDDLYMYSLLKEDIEAEGKS
ncbi:GNAT family protein [Alkalihalophilus lindianensis]|uniref:GNAT family protein n=1 Tax=Alkalihalophilus lindianensis TaxID=1630542 RepID=A0ABU3X4R1_9BACI|nr:GNAT family protein [Alkalihalophilus lindianensis]MDV2682869.1 GNAT family protein [Alkalihalophilus lindianensis]